MARKKRLPANWTPTLETYGVTNQGAIIVPEGGKVAGYGKTGVSSASSGLTLDGPNIVQSAAVKNASTTYGPDGKPIVAPGATLPANPSREALLGKEEAARVKAVVDQGPNAVSQDSDQNVAQKGLTWVASFFDTTDTFKEDGSIDTGDLNVLGGEFILDGALRLLQYGTDRLNQVTVAGLSVLPGGTETLTWDESNDISVGQQIVANAGVSVGKFRRGEGNIFDAYNALATLPGIGGNIAYSLDPQNKVMAKGFDITDAKDREAFTQGWERAFSLTGDVGFAFADPTIFVGWAAKAGKLRYIDRLIDSDKKMYQIIGEAANGKTLMERNLYNIDEVNDGTRTIEANLTNADQIKMSPVARFLYDAVKVDENGKKVTSAGELMKHRVIKYATNRDALSQAFHRAKTYDEAMLVLRHAAGDVTAKAEMLDARPDILAEILDGERAIVYRALKADPRVQAKLIAEFQNKADQYDAEIAFLQKQIGSDPEAAAKIKFVREKKAEIEAKRDVASSFDQTDVYNTPEYLDVSEARLKYLREHDGFLKLALDDAANGGSNSMFSSLRGSVAGFSSDTAFGRTIAKSRAKRASAAYETEMSRGAGSLRRFEKAINSEVVTGARMWQRSAIGMPGLSRVVNVWRYLGQEAPSGIVHIAGISSQESTREVSALLNSVRMYAGKGKTITLEDGTTKFVGGVQRKEEILTKYQNAMLEGGVRGRNEAANIMNDLEDEIKRDLIDFYNLNEDEISKILNQGRKSADETANNIRERKFYIDEKGNENAVPYLETHLQNAVIALPWRAIEKRVMRNIRHATSNDLRKNVRIAGETATDYTANIYSGFQDLWRPAVLLRLGYTQRNVAEGLFRSSAFQFSLAPVGLAAKQLGLSTTNVARTVRYGREGTRGAVGAARTAAADGAPFPRKLVRWREKQLQALDNEIEQTKNAMNLSRLMLAQTSEQWRVSEIERLNSEAVQLTAERSAIRSSKTMTQDEIDDALEATEDRKDEIYQAISLLDSVRGAADEPLSIADEAELDNLRYYETRDLPMKMVQRKTLDNDVAAAALFRQQTMAKRRLFQGEASVADQETLRGIFMGYAERQAFAKSDPYAEMALANLSADGTNRMTAAMRSSTAERYLARQITRYYVKVNPNEPAYFDGAATMLGQWQNSAIGSRIIADVASGKYSDDVIAARIAAFMRDTPEGREIAAFVTHSADAATDIKLTPHPVRKATAETAREKELAPLQRAIEDADIALKNARQEVRDAKKRLKQEQKTNPKRKALYDSQGKRIANADAYIERHRKALSKANKKYADVSGKPLVVHEYGGDILVPILSIDDALAYGIEMVRRYRRLTADSVDLQGYLASSKLPISSTKPKEAGDIVKQFIGPEARDAQGNAYVLSPVVGNPVTEVGTNTLMETIRTASAFGFKWLGTVPEDTFVRAPFYGRRFSKMNDDLMKSVLAQKQANNLGDTLTGAEINMIRDTAHRRALKDTKDWLYTIDRRTLLGEYAETIFPFISASQNSVTTVGRIIWNDPRVAALMMMIWNAPDRAGIADKNGDMHFTLPLTWMPEGLREKFGLDAMQDLTFNKNQFNLVFPQSGFGGYVPTPTPLAALTFSEMMKHGIAGIGPVAPDILVQVLGQENADVMWDVVKSYVYGSDQDLSGMSTNFLSMDKVLPPVAQKFLQIVQGAGDSSAYTSWYDKIYQSEYLQFAAGYRDTEPTPAEIEEKTRNFYLLRIAANVFAFSPPGYTSKMQPILDDIRKVYDTTPNREEADGIIYSRYGSTIQQLVKITATESVAGLPATPDSIRFAENNEQMISTLAPTLQQSGNLNVLGIFATESDADYDPSISAAQQVMKIAGTDEYYRQVRNPNEAAIDAQVSAGWAQYLKNMDVINSMLNQRGLKSLQAAGAKDLLQMKKEMVDKMYNDPRYRAWYGDYKNFASSRNDAAVLTIDTALKSKSFRENNQDSPIWSAGGIAEQYMYYRNITLDLLSKATSSEQKSEIKAAWQEQRGQFAASSPEWAAKQERYLSADDDPEQPQLLLIPQEDVYTQPQQEQQYNMYGEPILPGDEENGLYANGGM